jgi:hypothetical protein
MKEYNWDITFSIGAITFFGLDNSLVEAIRKVDELMYSVKLSGKSNIQLKKEG